MRMWKTALALTAIALLTSCKQAGGKQGGSNKSSDENNIVIGIAAPFTGNSAEFGEQVRRAVEIAMDEINNAGGINGRKLELNMQDDAGKADDAQKVATKLATNERVLAVVGHFNSQCSMAAKDIYTQAGMIMFSPASTAVDVTRGTDFVYRNIFTDDFQGQSLATYVGKVLGLRKVAIMFDNDDYGMGLKESFKKKAAELGVQVVTEQSFITETTDFRTQLTAISAAQPEIIMIGGLYTQAAYIAKQARELGIKTPFIGGDGLYSEKYVELAGDAAEGTIISCPFLFDLGGEAARKFAEDFRTRYKREPDTWAALTYDALKIIIKALQEKGTTRQAVVDYLRGVNSPETAFEGLAGKTWFDAEGDTKRNVQMATVKNGKFVAAEKQLEAGSVGSSTGSATSGTISQTRASTETDTTATTETVK